MSNQMFDALIGIVLAFIVIGIVIGILSAYNVAGNKQAEDLSRLSDKQRISFINDIDAFGLTCEGSGLSRDITISIQGPKIKYNVADDVEMIAIGEINLRNGASRLKEGQFDFRGADDIVKEINFDNNFIFEYTTEQEDQNTKTKHVTLGEIYVIFSGISIEDLPEPTRLEGDAEENVKFILTLSLWKNSLCVEDAKDKVTKTKSLIDICPDDFLGGIFKGDTVDLDECSNFCVNVPLETCSFVSNQCYIKDEITCKNCPEFNICEELNLVQCNQCNKAVSGGCVWKPYESSDSDKDGICTNPNKGRILYSSIDDDKYAVQTYDFQLRNHLKEPFGIEIIHNDGKVTIQDGIAHTSGDNYVGEAVIYNLDDYDYLDSDGNECIFVLSERSKGLPSITEEGLLTSDSDLADSRKIYYVKPGSIIEKRDIGRLGDGLDIVAGGCEVSTEPGDFSATICWEVEEAGLDTSVASVGSTWYDHATSIKNECGNDCNLLSKSSGEITLKDDVMFFPRREIICDDDGFWNVCGNTPSLAKTDGSNNFCNVKTGEWFKIGEGKKVIGAKILHVKIDPFDTPTEVWAFHLTDEIGHSDKDDFYKENFDENYCNVYAKNEEGGGTFSGKPDIKSVWHVNPGAVVSGSLNNLEEGLGIDAIEINEKGKKPKASMKRGNEPIGAEPFTFDHNSNCGQNDEDIKDSFGATILERCNLLHRNIIDNDRDNNDFSYFPKYGLVCADDKEWKVCDSYVEEQLLEINGASYECISEIIGGNEIFRWDIK